VIPDTACGRSFKPDWFCSRTRGHDGPCALWPISHEAADTLNRTTASGQHRIDSLAEALTNTAIGFLVSLVTWIIVARLYGIPMTTSTSLQITGWFTVVSVLRQYLLRRLFDGRSPWQALKGCMTRVSTLR